MTRRQIPELDNIEFPIDEISVKEEMYNEIVLCTQCRFICGKVKAEDDEDGEIYTAMLNF